ncbi:MAG: hypothetical protein ABS75_18585 [Pelagibacterium sp. SCN 63-23]|nr:MAG: hypothetical protein ABS75_18585 [Pelagibacterium sp. SCN 63-23]
MRALSLFARDELHMYRSMMVDRLLNKSSIEDFGDNFHGAMSVLDRISDRGANASATEAYLLRYPSTGGYIDTDINIKKFAQAVANKSSQKIYNNEKFHRYLKMSLVRPNRNFFVLLIIIDAVVKHYPNFANFVHSSDLDYILDQEDMRMATNIMTSYPELMRGFSGED